DVAGHRPAVVGLPLVDRDVLTRVLNGLPSGLWRERDVVRTAFKCPVGTRDLNLFWGERELCAESTEERSRPGMNVVPADVGREVRWHLNAVVGEGGRPRRHVAAVERGDMRLARLFDRLCCGRIHAHEVLLLLGPGRLQLLPIRKEGAG